MGYVTKWLIIEEFSIFLNHRILSEKWVGMLRIIQALHFQPSKNFDGCTKLDLTLNRHLWSLK
jgi:hypothetical protein